MEFKSNVPIYLQVVEDIRHKIIRGELVSGDKLPSSRELALQYEINPNTAARVYGELERLGISYTKRGIGTFITDDAEAIEKGKKMALQKLIEQFILEIEKIGYTVQDIPALLKDYSEKKGENNHEARM